MADETPKAPETPETARENAANKPRRRRPAPTIDLAATEIPPADTAGDTPTQEFLSAAEGETSKSRRVSISTHLVAGLAGGGVVALVLFAMWLSGLVPIRYAGTTAMRARVTGLELQVKDLAQDLANKPAANNVALDGVSERIGKIEQSLAKTPTGDPASAERLAAVENAMKSLGITLTALTRRADEVAGNAAAGRDEIATLQRRIEALETTAKSRQEQVAAISNADTAARLAVTALTLRDAVARGEPYATQIAVLRTLGADPKSLALLEPFAATGVPSEAALSRELSALMPSFHDAGGASVAAPAGFVERLQANANKLVRVRPVGAPAGDDASAALARLEVDAARRDFTAAQADIAKLPAKSRALADAWSKRVDARKAALAAAASVAADAARSLGNPSKSP
jgi:hypothetical protein